MKKKEYRKKFDDFVVMLSPIEKNIFAKVSHLSGLSEAVWIKDTVFVPTKRELKIRDDIYEAIKDEKQISFTYDNEQIDCFNPVKIYENMEDKMLYCFGYNADMEPELMRLDKIRVPEVSDSEVILPDDVTEFLEKMEYTWGADLPEGEIYHVKLKIFKETAREYLCLGSVQAIYKYEKGKCFPQADTLLALMELYDADIFDITGDHEEDVQSSYFFVQITGNRSF